VRYGEVTNLMTDADRVVVFAKAEKEAMNSDEVMKAAIAAMESGEVTKTDLKSVAHESYDGRG
jgi:hypothetical protein